MCQLYVAYYRVSTAKQGKSGLGLEAQEAAALAFIAGKGSDAKLLASFTEVESGKRDDRPELAKAMEHARLHWRDAPHRQARPVEPRRALFAWPAKGGR